MKTIVLRFYSESENKRYFYSGYEKVIQKISWIEANGSLRERTFSKKNM